MVGGWLTWGISVNSTSTFLSIGAQVSMVGGWLTWGISINSTSCLLRDFSCDPPSVHTVALLLVDPNPTVFSDTSHSPSPYLFLIIPLILDLFPRQARRISSCLRSWFLLLIFSTSPATLSCHTTSSLCTGGILVCHLHRSLKKCYQAV